MLATRGLGGPQHTVPTAGLGVYENAGVGGGKPDYDVAPRRIYSRRIKEEPALTIEGMRAELEQARPVERAVIVIDGEEYGLWEGVAPPPAGLLQELPIEELQAKIKAVERELDVLEDQAIAALEERAEKEIKAAQEVKISISRDDEDFMVILMAADA